MRALDLFCGGGGATRGLQEAGFHVTGVDVEAQPHYCGDVFHQANALEFEFAWAREFVGGTSDHHPELCDRCGLHSDLHFDFVWASPPCKRFTQLWNIHKRDWPNLIPQTRKRLVDSGIDYCIENVEKAPLGESGFLIMLCGTMFGLQTGDGRAELRRHRIFETSFSIPLVPRCQHGVRCSLSVAGKGGNFAAPRIQTVITVTGNGLDDNRMRQVRHRKVITVTGHTPVENVTRRTISITGSTPQANVERNVVREVFTVNQAREAMGISWLPMSRLSQAIPPAYSEFIARSFLASRNHLKNEIGAQV